MIMAESRSHNDVDHRPDQCNSPYPQRNPGDTQESALVIPGTDHDRCDATEPNSDDDETDACQQMAGIREGEDALIGCETGIVRVEHEVGGKADRYEQEPEQAHGHIEAGGTGRPR